MNARVALAAVSLVSLLGGCSGDARPFEEAIEVDELGLERLLVEPPGGSVLPLTVNAGEHVDFTLVGRDAADVAFAVPGDDRDWRVSDSSVASIDEDGRLRARADGTVTVSARIGDVLSAPFELTVSTAALTSIERVDGPDGLDPCLPAEYAAVGRFADDSVRRLRTVGWEAPTIGARLVRRDDGGARLVATRPGSVTLIARLNEASLAREIDVADSLVGLAIGPARLVGSVGATQQLSATGTYGDDAREIDVTDSVDWSVESGAELIEVDDEGETPGLVTAREAGDATVRAACGDVFDVQTYQVSAAAAGDDDDDEGLSFQGAVNGQLSVPISGSGVQLRVSTGDRYDSREDVTELATWRLLSGETVVVLVTDGINRGFVSPISTGVAVVEVSYAGERAELTVNVVDSPF